MWHINMMVMQLSWGCEDGKFSSLEFKASSDVGFVKDVITIQMKKKFDRKLKNKNYAMCIKCVNKL
jgi:hypothetical protein